MKKLIIQIPCYNEEKTLGITLSGLPRAVPGFDVVEWLIIDDGSTDGTADVAKAYGVEHIIRHPVNKGLAAAFMTGLHACLDAGADVIVNTDADNQYYAGDIENLATPILEGRAEMVVGARPIEQTEHFSPIKKLLQRLGSRVVRIASQTSVEDAPSGFRAISRDVAMRLNVFSEYTYTLETIIQAGQKGFSIVSVPVRTNPDLRESRLLKNISSYVQRSVLTIFRIFITYRPLRFFGFSGSVLFFLGFLIGLRFLVLYFSGEGQGNIQSLILSALLLGGGFQLIIVGLIADLIAVNRKMLENIQYRISAMAYKKQPETRQNREDTYV